MGSILVREDLSSIGCGDFVVIGTFGFELLRSGDKEVYSFDVGEGRCGERFVGVRLGESA